MKIKKTNHGNCVTFGFTKLSQRNAKRLYIFLVNKFNNVDTTNVHYYFSNDNLYGYFICK